MVGIRVAEDDRAHGIAFLVLKIAKEDLPGSVGTFVGR